MGKAALAPSIASKAQGTTSRISLCERNWIQIGFGAGEARCREPPEELEIAAQGPHLAAEFILDPLGEAVVRPRRGSWTTR